MKYIVFCLLLLLAIPSYAGEVVVVERQDGGVTVIHPSGRKSLQETIDETVIELGLVGQPYKVIDDSDLPSRDSRDAWTLDGNKVKIDKDKEKEAKDKKDAKVNIEVEIRKLAIDSLKAKGDLPNNYSE